jgi:hypothetical protein
MTTPRALVPVTPTKAALDAVKHTINVAEEPVDLVRPAYDAVIASAVPVRKEEVERAAEALNDHRHKSSLLRWSNRNDVQKEEVREEVRTVCQSLGLTVEGDNG